MPLADPAIKRERLREYSRELRREATHHEKIMWSVLRDRRLVDYKFRRQVPIGSFIVDFACFDAKFVVELDGSQHAESVRDEHRDAELERRGFRVLRVWNGDLIANREIVLDTIVLALGAVAPPSSGLRPPSPIEGEGAGTAAAGEQR